MPLAPLDVEGELTTPTGAAIVAALADEFGPLPAMTVERIGYGAGQKDFPQPNILRLLRRARRRLAASSAEHRPHVESIVVLETNLDNCPGEAIGHAVDRLWAAGALDVALTPIQMKKGRPGVLVSVQAQPADADALEAILFQETTTLGVRRHQVHAHRAGHASRTKSTRPGARSPARSPICPTARRGSLPNTKPATACRPNTACRWPTCWPPPGRHFGPTNP